MQALGKPATRADVIGWAFSVPLFLSCLAAAPMHYSLPGKYEPIFESFGGALPWITDAYIGLGGAGAAIVVLVLGSLPLGIVLAANRSWVKVAAPLLGIVVAVAYQLFVTVALMGPIVQVMRDLDGV